MVVLLFGIILLESVRRGSRDAEAILAKHEVSAMVQQLTSRLKDAETSTRGFYITGDPRYVGAYREASAEIRTLIADLEGRALTAHQQEAIDRLRAVASERVDALEDDLLVWSEGGVGPPEQAGRLERGTRIMDEARALTMRITQQQEELLESRARRASSRSTQTAVLIAAGVLLVGALTVLVELVFSRYGDAQRESLFEIEKQNGLLRKQARELEAVRSDLERTNGRLRRSLEQTAAGEARLRALIQNSAEVILVTDERARIRFESPAGERILGYSAEERIGRDAFENVHPEDVRGLRRSFVAAKRRDEPATAEFRAQRRDGTYATISATIVNRLEDPAVGGIVANLLDVSELRSSEQKLIQAQKMEAVGRLAGGVAHDFNNILMVIRGSAEMALQEVSREDAVREDLEEIASAADRGATLTRQLLTISRSVPVESQVVNVNELILDVERLLRRTLGEDIEFVTSLEPEIGRVKVEPGQLEQILMNLAVNARDAMPRGGSLITETRSVRVTSDLDSLPPGEYVRLSVTDTGVGMSREVRDRVFEPFFTTKPPGYGTGLGLSTVYGIVNRAGGHIWVYSEPDHGTTFKIYLPVTESSAHTEEARPREGIRPGTGKILVVEDEDAVRAITRRMLTRLGYEVVEAASAEEALELTERLDGRIDGIISDVVLPTMPGPELASRISERWPHVTVLFASGYTDRAMARYGVLDGGAEFIQKPYNFSELASKVANLFNGV